MPRIRIINEFAPAVSFVKHRISCWEGVCLARPMLRLEIVVGSDVTQMLGAFKSSVKLKPLVIFTPNDT